MTFCQSARGTLTASSRRMIPALLTRISTRPNFLRTSAKSASGAAVSERSAANAAALPPAASMISTVLVGALRSWVAMVAPASARAMAMAWPIPPAEPVTSAILLSRRKVSRMLDMMQITLRLRWRVEQTQGAGSRPGRRVGAKWGFTVGHADFCTLAVVRLRGLRYRPALIAKSFFRGGLYGNGSQDCTGQRSETP